MFLGAYFKAQSQDPNVSIMTVWKKFHQQKTLIIYHHLLLPVVAFPLTVWSVSIALIKNHIIQLYKNRIISMSPRHIISTQRINMKSGRDQVY